MRIANRSIGVEHPPLVIAEMSGNHNQSIERALEIVEAAAAAGAHAIKLQTYTPDTMTLPLRDGAFFIDDPSSLWHGRSLHELYSIASTPWEWHPRIMDRARELNLACFSTPFDETAVDFLENLDVPCYKIASFENAHLPLLRRVAATGKPVLLSTGMATLAELDESVRALRTAGCRDLILLKCTSTYPAKARNTNLMTIPHMRTLFGIEVGLSDHTMGVGAAVAAVALGASVIEKHFTLRRSDGGVDSAFSLEPPELANLVTETLRAWEAMGKVHYGPVSEEMASLRFRRSIYVVAPVKAGEALTRSNLRIIRPGFGLAPRFFEILLGKKAIRDLTPGTPVDWSCIG